MASAKGYRRQTWQRAITDDLKHLNLGVHKTAMLTYWWVVHASTDDDDDDDDNEIQTASVLVRSFSPHRQLCKQSC